MSSAASPAAEPALAWISLEVAPGVVGNGDAVIAYILVEPASRAREPVPESREPVPLEAA